MKRLMTILLVLVMVGSLVSCAGEQDVPETSPGEGGFELALVTDATSIDDKSFNQSLWEALTKYANEHDITHTYYQTSAQTDEACLAVIDEAVSGGAKLIAAAGSAFAYPIFDAQERYPDIYFVLIDSVPHTEDGSGTKTGEHTISVMYEEEQAGFLAGYAVVKDGFRKVGFIGGQEIPAVICYGYGFIQGCDYAAQELGLSLGDVVLDYHYAGSFEATPEAQEMATSWYEDGTEIIFACGGLVINSVIAASEQTGGKIIGVDVDQSDESPAVVTSAMKSLGEILYTCISSFYDGTFPGGETLVGKAANGGVGLPLQTSRFETFSEADYNAIFAKLVDGSIQAVGSPGYDAADVILTSCVVTRVTK